MENNKITKEEITKLGIIDTKQTYASNIAIFKHDTGVVLFNILENGEYSLHPASQSDFLRISKSYSDPKLEESRK